MKRAPVVIDNASGRVLPDRGPVKIVLRHAPPPPEPSIGAVLDTIARDAIENIARDTAKEIRRVVRRGLGGR